MRRPVLESFKDIKQVQAWPFCCFSKQTYLSALRSKQRSGSEHRCKSICGLELSQVYTSHTSFCVSENCLPMLSKYACWSQGFQEDDNRPAEWRTSLLFLGRKLKKHRWCTHDAKGCPHFFKKKNPLMMYWNIHPSGDSCDYNCVNLSHVRKTDVTVSFIRTDSDKGRRTQYLTVSCII